MSPRTFALAPGHTSWPSSKPDLILVEELEKLRLKAFLWGQKEASETLPKLQGSGALCWEAGPLFTFLAMFPSEVFRAETVWAIGGVDTCPSFVARAVFAAMV